MNSIITSSFLFKLIPMVFAFGFIFVAFEFLRIKIEKKLKNQYGETSSERIDRLSKALKESMSLIDEVEKEIQQRHAVVKRLQDDVNRYEELSKLKGSEVEAITQTLRGELRREGSKSLLHSVLISLFFFLAGVATTLFIS